MWDMIIIIGKRPTQTWHVGIKATDMSVKRSDIKYTGSAFIKYQLWFHALSQAFLVGIYSPVVLDLTKTINFTEGWHPLVDHLKGKKLRILSSRRIIALYSHIHILFTFLTQPLPVPHSFPQGGVSGPFFPKIQALPKFG